MMRVTRQLHDEGRGIMSSGGKENCVSAIFSPKQKEFSVTVRSPSIALDRALQHSFYSHLVSLSFHAQ